MNKKTGTTLDKVQVGLKKRYAAERRFQWYGKTAIAIGLAFLLILFGNVLSNGLSAFFQTRILLDVNLSAEKLGIGENPDRKALSKADYNGVVKASLRELFPEVKKRRAKRDLYKIASNGAAYQLRQQVMANPELVGQTISVWLSASDDVDMLTKGYTNREQIAAVRRLSDQQVIWVDQLIDKDRLERQINHDFFDNGDSREPELAGVWGAVMGSFYMLMVTLVLSFPIGIATAIYLEEFAPKNRLTDIIEVNINNLAAVPSIVFGLLGLAVFINFFGLPRSAPLVGGLVMTLMTLPTIIIAARASLQAVPPSIREAAIGVGASHLQMVWHHVLPLALPGMLTGTIIGMSRALGETAPLLMIGMVAFVVDIPQGITEPATALPVQIYLWADSPERAFVERTSAAILVLLAFLISMNTFAVVLRRYFERRW